MSRETAYAEMIGGLVRLIAALITNPAELPRSARVRLHLEPILVPIRGVFQGQAAVIASEQDASQRRLRLIDNGQRELDIQSFRGPSRPTVSGLPPP
jgi:hypothetical protein